jgi:tetratricopeptide (TPR) repeat protein
MTLDEIKKLAEARSTLPSSHSMWREEPILDAGERQAELSRLQYEYDALGTALDALDESDKALVAADKALEKLDVALSDIASVLGGADTSLLKQYATSLDLLRSDVTRLLRHGLRGRIAENISATWAEMREYL